MYEKIAYEIGKRHAQEKLAGMLDQAIRYGGPAAAGYYLAGPGYRTEGALGGLVAGTMLGSGAGRMALSRLHPSVTKATEGLVGAEAAAARSKAMKELVGSSPELLQKAELGGSLAMGAAGGYGAGRLLGLQNPYGLQPVFPGFGKENPYGMRPE